MKRESAINYGKKLVRRILQLYETDPNFPCMYSYSRDGEKINGKDPFEEIMDGYAEYIFPDDDDEEEEE